MASDLDALFEAFRCTFFPVQALVVDDDPGVRRGLRRSLEHVGYTVIDAASTEEAMELLQRTHVPVDLLVTDVEMPGLSGESLVSRVRAQWPAMPVVYVSGDSRFASLGDDQSSITRFLMKPFSPAELVEAAAAVLAGQQSGLDGEPAGPPVLELGG
jgi:two-component system cell cycle sensor histidine kinase/response regulator CckA